MLVVINFRDNASKKAFLKNCDYDITRSICDETSSAIVLKQYFEIATWTPAISAGFYSTKIYENYDYNKDWRSQIAWIEYIEIQDYAFKNPGLCGTEEFSQKARRARELKDLYFINPYRMD
jgi:hypothetical protein